MDNFLEVIRHFNKEHALAIGKHIYKIRLRGLGKGKSGGYRTYILFLEKDKVLSPLCIYAKNEKENISLKELNYHLSKVKEELI